MATAQKRKASTEHDEIIVRPRSHKQAKITASASTMLAPSTSRVKTVMKKQYASSEAQPATRQKRKRGADIAPSDAKSRDKRAVIKDDAAATTPQAKRVRTLLPPTPAETPSKKAATLLDRLGLKESTPSTHKDASAYSTPPATPDAIMDFQDVLPQPLTELVRLQAAFLSALNEQLALSSSTFRVDIKQLLQAMTSIWKKRAITIEDVRKVTALSAEKELGWRIEDYGRAGLSFVRLGDSTATNLAILDTAKLKKRFEKTLRAEWQSWQQHEGQISATTFVEELPLATITQSEVVDSSKAILARGKNRLADIKDSQKAATEKNGNKPIATTESSTARSRGTSLLDRILAKQAANAAKPAGPTKEELSRRSALQRVEEIARVLDVLSAGRARASFSMQSVVQQLQQSLRNPISRLEAQQCLTIMAAEIMPHFLTIVHSGAVTGIVITRAGKLGFADLKKRLADADEY